MKRFIVYSLMFWLWTTMAALAQNASVNEFIDSKGTKQLAGLVPLNSLKTEPYSNWFQKEYINYYVDSKVAKRLGNYLKDMDIHVFMGTWCGDSKREVPRLVRVLEIARIDPEKVNFICVYPEAERRNTSPTQEQKGKGIHHVPTIILFKNGKEVGRLIEKPALSLEEDLLQIASGGEYTPKYAASEALRNRITLLSMPMNDTAAWQKQADWVDSIGITAPWELNRLAKVFSIHQQYAWEAATLRINSLLFPGFPAILDGLSEALRKNGDKDYAQQIDLALLKQAESTAAKAKKRLEQPRE